jgi:hypothetical protein
VGEAIVRDGGLAPPSTIEGRGNAPELPGPAGMLANGRDNIGRLERDQIENLRMATIRNLAQALDVEPRDLLAD